MATSAPQPGDQYVQSLARGLAVIRAFDADRPEMTLSEVAETAGMSRATARRFLLTLVELGYMRTDGKRFALTPQVLRLGTAYLSGLGLPQIAQPHLERLSAAVGESTSLAVLDGPDIVYVARVATRRIMTVGISVGTRFPAPITSMGRVLLAGFTEADLEAHLDETTLRPRTPHSVVDPAALRAEIDRARAQGWAYVDQELEIGLRSIAAPVRGPDGRAVAALNVSTTVATDEQHILGEIREHLLAGAEAIAADLEAQESPGFR